MQEGQGRPSFNEDPSSLQRERGRQDLFNFVPFKPGRAVFLRDALKKVCEEYPESDGNPHFTQVWVAGKPEEAFVQYSGGNASFVLFREEGLYSIRSR